MTYVAPFNPRCEICDEKDPEVYYHEGDDRYYCPNCVIPPDEDDPELPEPLEPAEPEDIVYTLPEEEL